MATGSSSPGARTNSGRYTGCNRLPPSLGLVGWPSSSEGITPPRYGDPAVLGDGGTRIPSVGLEITSFNELTHLPIKDNGYSRNTTRGRGT